MIKTGLLIPVTLASMAKAKTVDAWTFFSGAHLGMTLKEYATYYFPISDTYFGYGGAPEGQQYVDFRSYGTEGAQHDGRVLVHYRESDKVIVAIEYWNASGKFSKWMIGRLKDLNKGYPGLITQLYDAGSDAELVVTTAAQDKLERDAINPPSVNPPPASEANTGVFNPPPAVSNADTDWARKNAARIEAEKKAKEAAGLTEAEKHQAQHDAEIRESNERTLRALQQPPASTPSSQP
jgi:hypothetical protein